MLQEQEKRRNRAFLYCLIIGIGAPLGLAFLAEQSENLKLLHRLLELCIILFFLIFQFFIFKGMYHWAKAKGYPGVLSLLGILGLPIGPIILACMPDKLPIESATNEPILSCPECDFTYQLSEYRPDAENIYCSRCNAKLPRNEESNQVS